VGMTRSAVKRASKVAEVGYRRLSNSKRGKKRIENMAEKSKVTTNT